jgi:hypothetical protein
MITEHQEKSRRKESEDGIFAMQWGTESHREDALAKPVGFAG